MKHLKDIFRRKREQEAQPLRIEGVPVAPMTAEPDDAELAAQALLEAMIVAKSTKGTPSRPPQGDGTDSPTWGSERGIEYYRRVAGRIRHAHEAARQRTLRFITFCEQELKRQDLPKEGPGSLGLLEAELYKRLDVVERHGGDLKRRWQHCLADVTVRLMGSVGDGLPGNGE